MVYLLPLPLQVCKSSEARSSNRYLSTTGNHLLRFTPNKFRELVSLVMSIKCSSAEPRRWDFTTINALPATMKKKVFHTCKSRFCSSCGVKQTDMWIETYTSLFANCEYQHVIFAPPHEFLDYFRIGRKRYFNCLYSVVNQTLTDWSTSTKTKPFYLPGFMVVMHTFGRSLSWHVHIHVLITCGGLNKQQNAWVMCPFIPHLFLKAHFKQHFLAAIQKLWDNENCEKLPQPLRVRFTPAYQENIVAEVSKKPGLSMLGNALLMQRLW